ncbi:histidine kinase [Spirosoma taeanense]|uniref:Histidine kinase n=1 Tax=Spirosoma taeanense TaxID=2735870 RepID=A0A6M5Y9E9_9BACT|nr:sensor histidine kinase [Spirosoma taeanense]QJW89432.1 histidine kinase [Spirosoma taeanense]
MPIDLSPETSQSALSGRPVLLPARQWWYVFGAFAWTVPIGNYILLGDRYWTDWRLLITATVFLYTFYAFAIFACGWVANQTEKRYSEVSQTLYRMGVMFGGVLAVTLLTICLTLLAYAFIPLLSIAITPELWSNLLRLGFIFDLLFCLAHGCLFLLGKWREKQMEKEGLQRLQIENQLDALKTQVNPHFLFNSLNSLSSLIGEDAQRAEKFVDALAHVYRYMLRRDPVDDPGRDRDLATLEDELRFATSYAYLLTTRYGTGISFRFNVDMAYRDCYLPRLTLQTLIDNATRHNTISPDRPLCIEISTANTGRLLVRNNRQIRVRRVDGGQGSLSALIVRYQLLGKRIPSIAENESHFSVWLPLIPSRQAITA